MLPAKVFWDVLYRGSARSDLTSVWGGEGYGHRARCGAQNLRFSVYGVPEKQGFQRIPWNWDKL